MEGDGKGKKKLLGFPRIITASKSSTCKTILYIICTIKEIPLSYKKFILDDILVNLIP